MDAEGQITLTPKLGRMSGFLPMGIPITLAMILAPPSIKNTVLLQWVNQSYMAGVNYCNKNESCPFTTLDLVKGYSAAVASSIFVGVGLRVLTRGALKSAKAGSNKLLLLNTLVSTVASCCATCCNTTFMRQAEVDQGIQVFLDEDLNPDS